VIDGVPLPISHPCHRLPALPPPLRPEPHREPRQDSASAGNGNNPLWGAWQGWRRRRAWRRRCWRRARRRRGGTRV